MLWYDCIVICLISYHIIIYPQEHLACFLPGTLALGYMAGLKFDNHFKMAENLTKTCYEMYARMPTGLAPEIASMNMNADQNEDFFVMVNYILVQWAFIMQIFSIFLNDQIKGQGIVPENPGTVIVAYKD